jgi:hypothetical protein
MSTSDAAYELRGLQMIHRLLCKNDNAIRMEDDMLVLELDEEALADWFGGDECENK